MSKEMVQSIIESMPKVSFRKKMQWVEEQGTWIIWVNEDDIASMTLQETEDAIKYTNFLRGKFEEVGINCRVETRKW